MKKTRITIFLTLTFLSLFLAACSGAPTESWAGVTVKGDSAYLSYGTQVYQIGLADGVEKARIPSETNPKTNFFAPVAFSEDGQILVGSYNHSFYSFPPGGAQASWTFSEAKDRYISEALVQGDQIFAGSADGNLYTLGLDGSLRWKFAAEHAIWGSPVSDGKTIFVASMDHYIYALNPQNGAQIWKTDDVGGQMVAQPALSDSGVLYVGAFGSRTDDPARSSRLVAVDSKDGKILWSAPTRGWVWATPLLKDNVLYFGDNEGFAYGLNAQTGEVVWQRQLDTSANRAIISAPVILNDRLYFGSKAGLLYMLNPADGSPAIAQPVTIGGQINADLLLAGQEILIAPTGLAVNRGEYKLLLAVNSDGIEQWSFIPAKK
jgi:outer membrane protein assembly factor BamB